MFQRFNAWALRNALSFAVLCGGAKCALGDKFAQTIDDAVDEFNWKRFSTITLFGVTYIGK